MLIDHTKEELELITRLVTVHGKMLRQVVELESLTKAKAASLIAKAELSEQCAGSIRRQSLSRRSAS